MSTIRMSGRSTTLPGDQTLAGTTGALEERAFSTEAVENVDDPRDAVLARIRKGSPVLNNTSVTLGEASIAEAIDGGGAYASLRKKILALDCESQAQVARR
jgi:hypothetical protein